MYQKFVDELRSVNRVSEFQIAGEPNSTLSQVEAGGTFNLLNLFNDVCDGVKAKAFDAGHGLEQVAEELNKDDFLNNFLDQVN